jgi:hypothetical protein
VDTSSYFEELISQMSILYKENSLLEISSLVNDLKYMHNLIVLEFIKTKLSKSNSGNVIDVEAID